MAKNGHYYHHQWNEHRLETQMCLDSSMLNFFLSLFFFFTPLNNYLQSDYMYVMATRTTTANDHSVKDDEQGTWDADDVFQVSGMFFLSFFFFVLLTNIYNLTTLQRQSHTTSTSTTNRAWDSDASRAPGIYFYFWHKRVRVWDMSWSVSTSRDVLFFSIYV